MEKDYQEFLSKDEQVFKTLVDIGEVDTKEYDLKTLLQAEKRVIRGTNKTMQSALNSITSLRQNQKQKSAKVDIKDVEFDEYGLSPAFYSENQIKFIRQRIDNYHNGFDIATPYQQQGVIQLAKNEWTIAELQMKIAIEPSKEDIASLKIITEIHAKQSNDLKLTPRQANGDANSEDILSNVCIAYEDRYRNTAFEFSHIDERDRLEKIMIDNADKIVNLMSESKTYFHFKDALAKTVELKAGDVDEIGYFTIEEFFDFLKINEDRKMIADKNELTLDENFKDVGDD